MGTYSYTVWNLKGVWKDFANPFFYLQNRYHKKTVKTNKCKLALLIDTLNLRVF